MATESIQETRVPWGEVEDDAEDEENFKTVEEIITNEKGQRVKVTRKIAQVKVIQRVNKRAEERRRKWKKFGDARDKSLEHTTSKGDILEFEYEKAGKTEKKTLEEQIKKEVAETLARSTKPGAWTARRLAQQEQEAAGGMRAPGGARLAATPGAYVPPGRARGEEVTTIRVSNLSSDADEDEIRPLFERFGYVTRVRLWRDKFTNVSKDVCFVTFAHREDAENALKGLAGVGLHHMIMQLEWAKPISSTGGAYGK